MIDVNSESLIPVKQVPEEIPSSRPGKKLAISTIYRWMFRGVRGVKLESVAIGGTRYTSREAIERFVERLSGSQQIESTARNSSGDRSHRLRTEARRRRDSERAAQTLEQRGA